MILDRNICIEGDPTMRKIGLSIFAKLLILAQNYSPIFLGKIKFYLTRVYIHKLSRTKDTKIVYIKYCYKTVIIQKR